MRPEAKPVPSLDSDSIWLKIKRHKLVEWSLAYIAFGYAALHGVEMLRDAFEWPLIVPRLTVFALLLGFPVAVTLAWYHGHRARQRISGPELLIVTLLLVVAGTILWNLGSGHKSVAVNVGAASVVAQKSIAVLPFVDLSQTHDQEYFADGMAEEILTLLAKIPELKVIGRTSSFQFKGKSQDLRQIGSALGVAYVVEGSVSRSGNHIRVTAQLITTQDGAHRWAETFDRDASDVFAMQDEIAQSLVRALDVEMNASVYVRRQHASPNGESYDAYLRGLHALDRSDQRGFDEAEANFQRALTLDPSFAPAASALALAMEAARVGGFVQPKEGFEQARAAAQAALKLDPSSAVAHAVLCDLHVTYDWDWVGAEREARVATALAPNDPWVLFIASKANLAVGRWEDARRLLDTAVALDPLSPAVAWGTGRVYQRLGRQSDAEASYRRVLDISPTYDYAHYWLGLTLLTEGKLDAAFSEMQRETLEVGRLAGLAVVYQAQGRAREAHSALASLQAEHAGDASLWIAEAYAFRGQKDEAFLWLDRAYGQRDVGLYGIIGDPLLKNLEGDPRYAIFLRKMKLTR
jgi:TolB-like protein/Flp pilus assembly protein TadD